MLELRELPELTSNSTELGPLLDPLLGRLLLLLLLKLKPFPVLVLGRALLLKLKPLPELGRLLPPTEELGLELPPPPKLICLFSRSKMSSFSVRLKLTRDSKTIDFIIIIGLTLTPEHELR